MQAGIGATWQAGAKSVGEEDGESLRTSRAARGAVRGDREPRPR
jgi:hypothetical protein